MKITSHILKEKLKNRDVECNIIDRGEYLDSSVLILITEIEGESHIVFEKRGYGIRQGGEICFPGGIREKNDSDRFETALRECEEEIGIAREKIKEAGKFGTMVIGSGIIVEVYAGFAEYEEIRKSIVNRDEVESVVFVPVQFFIDSKPEQYKIKTVNYSKYVNEKGEEEILFPAESLGLPELYHKNWSGRDREIVLYKYKDEMIWGITGKIIQKFIEIL